MLKIYRDKDIFEVIDEFSALFVKVFGKTPEIGEFLKFRIEDSIAAKRNAVVIVKLLDNKIIGGLFGFDFMSDSWYAGKVAPYIPKDIAWYDGKCFELNELFVDEAHQRRGIGRELMKQAEGLGFERIILSTAENDNRKAVSFYENLGYQCLARGVKLGDDEDKLVLYKEL